MVRRWSIGSMQLGRYPGRNNELGNNDPRAGAFSGDAVEVKLVIRTVDDPQALVDVFEPDPIAALDALGVAGADADTVVDHVDDGVSVLPPAANRDASRADFGGQPVFDRVL